MSQSSKLALAVLLALPFFAGCGGMQAPSADDTKTGPNSGFVSPTSADSDNNLTPQTGDIPANIMEMLKSRNIPPELILATVYFDFNEYNIRPDQRADLETASKSLAADSGQKVVAVGYTDWYGSEQYDLALGDRRANAVKSFSTKLGVSDAQIETLSLGKLNAPTNVAKDSPEAKKSRVCVLVKLPSGASASSVAPASGADASVAAPATN